MVGILQPVLKGFAGSAGTRGCDLTFKLRPLIGKPLGGLIVYLERPDVFFCNLCLQ